MVKKNGLRWDAGVSDEEDEFDIDGVDDYDNSDDDSDEEVEAPKIQKKNKSIVQKIAPNVDETCDILLGLSKMKFPCNIIIAGQTDSGKTNLVKYLVYTHALQFNRIILLSPTADLQNENFLQKEFIITEVTPEKVERIISEQQKNKKWKTLLIFDDCIGSMSFKNSSVFDKLASSGRHYNTSTIHIVQDLNKLSPCIRNNSKYLFVTLCKEHQLKTCFELSTGFNSFTEFKEYMKRNCKNYQIVRFNLTGDADCPHLTFKSVISPKFKIVV